MRKQSAAMGSALPDPMKSQATVSPVPTPMLASKPAPGQTGPKGLSPRATYSRVNTGVPPMPGAGGPSQKNMAPQGLNFLPAKTAEVPMTTLAARPNLQDMLKSAMAGTIEKGQITDEATRQLATQAGEETEKEAAADPEHFSTEYVHKLAGAVGYLSEMYKAADDSPAVAPGKGPGATEVLESNRTEMNIDAGQLGSAIPANTPPKSPATQKEQVQVGKANTGLETNDDMSHPEQPTEPISNEKTSIGPVVAASSPTTQTKQSAVMHDNLVRMGLAEPLDPHVAMIRKVAEDAMNPAKIEAGKASPPDASASEEGPAPSQPSDVTRQAKMVGSNDAAINYDKGQAKADPKTDVNQLLQQPALSKKHDPVLHKVLDNTAKAGVKISHDMTKVAAARALLSKLQDKVAEEKTEEDKTAKSGKKQKESMMGAAPSNPSGASGFTASSLQ